jgi:TonB-dependent SusC/RagA subfamily outer membrane receptor
MKKYLLIVLLLLFEQLPAQVINVKGNVVSQEGKGIAGASITVKSKSSTFTNEKGEFALTGIAPGALLQVSSVGYEPVEVALDGRVTLTVTLQQTVGELDEVIMKAYGTTSQRLNTGNITKVSAAVISRQPVSNPLAALQGRVPGLVINQTSGVPGSTFSVEIRGRSSLDLSLSRNDPLFVIDGVPFEPGNQPANLLNSAVNNPVALNEGGISPLANINPADIESIEVLKDADATAIYGSRGANGVILITTKRGEVGKTSVNVSYHTGWSRVTRMMELLNTQQ